MLFLFLGHKFGFFFWQQDKILFCWRSYSRQFEVMNIFVTCLRYCLKISRRGTAWNPKCELCYFLHFVQFWWTTIWIQWLNPWTTRKNRQIRQTIDSEDAQNPKQPNFHLKSERTRCNERVNQLPQMAMCKLVLQIRAPFFVHVPITPFCERRLRGR